MAASPRPRQHGLTLIELLIVLSIAAILAMIGMPALGSILAHAHQRSAEGALHASLLHARETAIVRHMQVIVCPSPDQHTCGAWDDWQDGWLIAADTDRNREPDPGPPLAVFGAMPAQTRVLSSSGRPRVVFRPNGSASGSNAQLTVCNLGDTGEGVAVVVANSGRVRVTDAQPDRLRDCLLR